MLKNRISAVISGLTGLSQSDLLIINTERKHPRDDISRFGRRC
jgi:hypothetical protein